MNQNNIEIETLNNENLILNSEILKFVWEPNIEEGGLNITLILRPQVKKFKGTVAFKCLKVRKAAFMFDGQYDLGYVERYKFLKLANGDYYLSLDPYDEFLKEVSDLDNEVLTCEDIIRVING